MATTTLSSYAEVQGLLNSFLQVMQQNGVSLNRAHKDFWNQLTYEQFRDGDVPHVSDPDTGSPLKVLVVGKPDESNLIMALRGVGPLFDPNNGSIGRMPLNSPVFMPGDQIDALADWIKRGCPN